MRNHEVEHLKGELGFGKVPVDPIGAVQVVDIDVFVHVGESFGLYGLFG